MSVYCGIVLTGDEDTACALAFLTDDGTVTYSTPDDETIIERIEDHRPDVIALNAPQEQQQPKDFHAPIEPQDDDQAAEESSDDDNGDDHALHPATAAQFRSGEEELIADGYSMLPTAMRDRRLLERAEFLSNSIKRSGIGATIIESNPRLVAERLDIGGDTELKAYGVETEDIDGVREFDALLLALTAKFFDEDKAVDKDIIIPETLDEMGGE